MKTVFLFDVDDTLLDSGRIMQDFRAYLLETIGERNAKNYWNLVERERSRCGCEDYLSAIQSYRTTHPRDQGMVSFSRFLLEYPFKERLFPRALEILAAVERAGNEVLLFSEGETLFQTLKIERSGIWSAVSGKALVYARKGRQLKDVAHRFPAEHYVAVDDNPGILSSLKRSWGDRVTTVLVTVRGRKVDSAALLKLPPDIVLEGIGQLLDTNILWKGRPLPTVKRKRIRGEELLNHSPDPAQC